MEPRRESVRALLHRLWLALGKRRARDGAATGLPSGFLARREGFEGNQEGEDAGTCCRHKGQEKRQDHSQDDQCHLRRWRQLLQLLKHLFHVHGFPLLAFSGILKQSSWCRRLTRRICGTISRGIAMRTESVAVWPGEKWFMRVQNMVKYA